MPDTEMLGSPHAAANVEHRDPNRGFLPTAHSEGDLLECSAGNPHCRSDRATMAAERFRAKIRSERRHS